MKVQDTPPLHLTYCLNVHRGETWGENFQAIRDKALRVRDAVAADGQPFAIGLRLSARAAAELCESAILRNFADFLAREHLYVFTINGFPYGQFHDTAVKEDVYRPDWRDPRRLAYTNRMADLLAAILPEDTPGSISTVPGSYKPWIRTPADLSTMVAMLADAAVHLDRLDREICLALEPEPDCYLATMDELLNFCTGPLLEIGIPYLAESAGLSNADAERVLRKRIGVCFDTAHMAVEFEDLAGALNRLASAGVPLAKVHLSSALRLRATPATLARLADFCEEVYLHQVKVRGADGRVRSYPDLPQALADAPQYGDEWRVHFHVPLFFEEYEGLRSTTDLFTDKFISRLKGGITQQIEIETYTFGVLPAPLRAADITEAIAREYRWTLNRFFG